MPKRVCDLNDNWQFAWTAYVGRDRHAPSADRIKTMHWYPASVPGSAQDDLHKLGMLEDPFFADNADHYRWCEEVDFWYRCRIEPVELPHGTRAILHFDGLDTFATIWIDGKRVGGHANMFVPYWIDVTNHLHTDEPVELLVRFGASAFEADWSHRDPCNHPPLQRARTRKAQISYGWDIGPRIVTVGLWRGVRLEIIDRGRILYGGARTLSSGPQRAHLEAVITVDWYGKPSTATVRGRYGPLKTTNQVELTRGLNDVVIPFGLSSPKLWWPRGHGRQNLYEFSVDLIDEAGKTLDTYAGRFGVCKVDLLQEPRDDGGRTFRFKVNGKDFFVKGLNWTPCEAVFGRTKPDRIKKLVRLAADANANMLRVWGGGVYEGDQFRRACDEAGLLVWQDFMFACSAYPQDARFLNAVRAEAELVVRAFRGHVSLALWCGDNEVDWLVGPEPAAKINRTVLAQVLEQLDAQRPYIPSSPFSPPGIDPNDPRFGDCHLWNHLVRPDDEFYTAKRPNIVSEIGRISLPGEKTIDAFLPADKQWPVDNPLWIYHSSDPNRWRAYRNISHVMQCVRAHGHPAPQSLQELIEVTQNIQADHCRFWIEHYGRDPYCWGLLLWNLCDCWPQVSDAIISYDLELKPAYYAIKQAYAKLNR